MTVERVTSLADIDLPKYAVVIADEALPDELLAPLPDPILVSAGESLKTLESVGELAGKVLARRASRPLVIVGVGGGSVGDAVGFLASTLWRGVELWHVPSTLLAMVDSAHGGKTAVNLGAMKNQLGTFYPAERVLLVDDILATLPHRQREQGLVELIKGLWLGDAEAVDLLDVDGGVGRLAAAPFGDVSERLMGLLERAIDVKLDIVDQDMYEEKGIRTFLNLGHTAAHALELHAGLPHGEAVAWGMMAAGRLSASQGDLSEADAERIRQHLYPVVHFSRAVLGFEDRASFDAALLRDKKRVEGELRSVLLSAPGEPYVTRDVSSEMWFDALREEIDLWERRSVHVRASRPTRVSLEMEASKSELNRALAIRAVRPAATTIHGSSSADDVQFMTAAVDIVRQAADDEEIAFDAGEGGTTFRFLTAIAASRPGKTRIFMHERLRDRPHEALYDALRAAGASIETFRTGRGAGIDVRGWQSWPERVRVDASESSQFASAIALLAASGHGFELTVGDDIASRPYLDLSFAMLRDAGVEVIEADGVFALKPTDAVEQPCTLLAEADASSAAVWRVAEFLGHPVDVSNPPSRGWQPDERVGDFLDRLKRDAAQSEDETAEFDVGTCPDLVPVLTVAAMNVPCAVRFVGAAHLRHKESNRIDDLIASLGAVGLVAHPLEDGLEVPSGVQRPEDGARWMTEGDHRLAFAGALLTKLCHELRIDDPWVVAKSYPEFWHDCRRAGFDVVPVG
ncbi:MAG: 3-dehydroquinate synthase family protein [Myxococcota bacterium]